MPAANTISLSGSASICSEFFGYSIQSILYQRGLYDPDSFNRIHHYGLPLTVTTDPALQSYLKRILVHIEDWLSKGLVKRLVLVISSADTEETLERWQFDVTTTINSSSNTVQPITKPESEINKEIAAILRQITSSVSFLPLLSECCTFDLLVYTPNDCKANTALWEESDPKYINKANEVRLRSFSTKIHQVETAVAYKAEEL